jgi:hypothetical protein
VNCPYWVLLPQEKCIGQHFHELRSFCEERRLSLSRHGHPVVWEHNIYQVCMFASDEDAEVFRQAFDGEGMHPSEKGRASIGQRGERNVLGQEGLSRRASSHTLPGLPGFRLS